MKPHDRRPRKRSAERALRTYLRQHLGWLQGHPLGGMQESVAPRESLSWRIWEGREGPAQDVTIDRESLRRATFGLRGAPRKFPRALPRLVGDVDAWRTRLESRLAFVTAALHQGSALPDSASLVEGRASQNLRAALEWCATELAWLTTGLSGSPRFSAEELAKRITSWRGAIESVRRHLGQDTALRLAGAIATGAPPGPEAAARIQALIMDPRTFELPLEEADARKKLRQRLRAIQNATEGRHELISRPIEGPRAQLGADVAQFLLHRPKAPALELVAAAHSVDAMDAWSVWWDAFRAFERGARSALGRSVTRKSPARDVTAMAQEFTEDLEDLESPPDAWRFSDVTELAGRLVSSCTEPVLGAITDVARLVPDATLSLHRPLWSNHARCEVLEEWAGALERGLPMARAEELALLQLELLEDPNWTAEEAGLAGFAFVAVLLDAYKPPPELPWKTRGLARDVIAELISLGEPGRVALQEPDSWRCSRDLVEIVRAMHGTGPHETPATRAAELILAARKVDAWFVAEFAATLAALTPSVPAGSIFEAASKLGTEAEDLSALLGPRPDADRAQRLAGLLLDGEHGLVHRLAILARSAAKLGADTSPPKEAAIDRESEALAELPTELRPAAGQLLALGGASGLERALKGTLHHPDDLNREIRALQAMPEPTPHQQARLETLQTRLRHPPVPTATQITAARRKLERRLRLAQAAAWEQALAGHLGARLPVSLGALLEDTESLTIVSALAGLAPAARRLAWRVLENEDLSSEPAHVQWRARMESKGRRLAPWLSTGPVRESVSPAGRAMVFRIERTPMEVFRMGKWFDTCLSPGEMNFFSVVANAADENKQLVVARDVRGVAQARCLLALTREGCILSFHVYAHEEHGWFRGEVQRFAQDLSAAIGAPLVPEGRVESLVATQWYNDGPEDLTGTLAQLESDGPLARELETAPLPQIPSLLTERLGTEALDAAFDQVVTREVFTKSPERMFALEPLIRSHRLETWTALDVAQTLRNRDPKLARDILVAAMSRRKGRSLELWDNKGEQFARLLAELGEPSLALRVLRVDELEGTAADLARALALAALGRKDQAKRLLAPLAESGVKDAIRQLQRLGA